MSIARHRRSLSLMLVLAFAALSLSGAAYAASTAKKHRKHPAAAARVHRVAKHRAIAKRQVKRTFAPTSLTRAAEVSAVVLDPITQQFMQVTFDRGRATAVSSSSITLEQKENGAVWRTQAFTVPSTAVVTLNGKAVSLSQIPMGSAVRVESSGAVGGTQSVVRVNAYSHGEAPLPASS